MKVSIYLNFNGNCAEAFEYYESVFGVKVSGKMTFDQAPPCDSGYKLDPKDAKRIMHTSLSISEGEELMGSDSCPSQPPVVAGTNVHINLCPESKARADELFDALSAGGKVQMKMQDMFWKAYFGMCTDKFGVQWMINFPLEDATEEKKQADE